MSTVENLAETHASRLAADDLSSARPGRLSRLVIVAVSPIIAESWLGPRLLTRARRTPTVRAPIVREANSGRTERTHVRPPRASSELDHATGEREEAARRYVEQLRASYVHAGVFAAGTLVIFTVNLLTNLSAGRAGDWSAWALLGWGVGIVVHGLVLRLDRPSIGSSTWEPQQIERMLGRRPPVTGNTLNHDLRMARARIERSTLSTPIRSASNSRTPLEQTAAHGSRRDWSCGPPMDP